MIDATHGETIAVDSKATDDQHSLQVELLAALHQAVAEGQPPTSIENLFEQLVEFTKMHFAAEATLMRLYEYPHYGQHMLEHDRALEDLDAVHDIWLSGEAQPTLDRIDAIAAGIEGHIEATDRAFGRYLAKLAIAAGPPLPPELS